MSIRRTRLGFESNYTRVPNEWVRDSRISLRARGLLAQIMSHVEGWQVSIDSLTRDNPEGRDAIRSAVAELKAAGYLTVREQRSNDGRWAGSDYDLADPFEPSDSPSSGSPTAGSPTAGRPTPKKNITSEDHREEDQNPSKADAPRRREGGGRKPASEAQRVLLADMLEALEESEVIESALADPHLTGSDADDLIKGMWGEIENSIANGFVDPDAVSPRMRAYLERRAS